LTPGSGKNSDPISGIRNNISDHFYESLVTVFWVKILKFSVAVPDPGSGIEKSGSEIRDVKIIIQDTHPGSATLIGIEPRK